MIIDHDILGDLTAEAKEIPRLRMNPLFDLMLSKGSIE